MTAETKSLTITLTGRAPVKIAKAEWPILAEAKWWDNQYESQANRTARLVVRQHEDGRAIVYGITTSQWQGESGARGGELFEAGASISDALYRVAESVGIDQGLVERCIADLPAEDLTKSPEPRPTNPDLSFTPIDVRLEEHTSELQSRPHLVCRLLLEKKKKK